MCLKVDTILKFLHVNFFTYKCISTQDLLSYLFYFNFLTLQTNVPDQVFDNSTDWKPLTKHVWIQNKYLYILNLHSSQGQPQPPTLYLLVSQERLSEKERRNHRKFGWVLTDTVMSHQWSDSSINVLDPLSPIFLFRLLPVTTFEFKVNTDSDRTHTTTYSG